MPKLPYLNREDLPEDKRCIVDQINKARGRTHNVFRAALNSPDAAEAIGNLGEYIRFKSSLDPAIREIAILATAQELNNEYEWSQHIPFARNAGVSEDVIDAIRSGRAPMGIPAKDGIFAQVAKELLRNGNLSERTFQAVEHLLGPAQTVDLIVLVGFYSMLSGLIKTLGVELEEDVKPDLNM